MIQTFSLAGVELHLGNAAELSHLHAGRADMVMTDPPYALTSGGRVKADTTHRVMKGIFDSRTYDNSGLLMAVPSWAEIASVLSRLAARDCDAYVMANDKNLAIAQVALEAERFRLHNILPWDKVSPLPNRWYMKHMEFTLYMWKGRARRINNPGSKQLFTLAPPRAGGRGAEKVHDTQKPVELMAHYILNSTTPGQMVIDPYAGSASTLVAAALHGRRAIGFEVDPGNFERAVTRLTRDLSHLA